MQVRNHFIYRLEPDLTAAHIGISKWEWTFLDRQDEAEAQAVMAKHKFDVLPIRESDGSYKQYYATREWNKYDKLNLQEISNARKIYYRLSFRDLLKKFLEDECRYYFLETHDETVGLVSLVHFNSLAVYNFLYQEIASLERCVSDFLKEHFSEAEVIEALKSTDDLSVAKLLQDYDALAAEGENNSIFDLTYLHTLGVILAKLGPQLPDAKKALMGCRKELASNGILTKVRNNVAHPVRPLMVEKTSLKTMNDVLDACYKIKNIVSGSSGF